MYSLLCIFPKFMRNNPVLHEKASDCVLVLSKISPNTTCDAKKFHCLLNFKGRGKLKDSIVCKNKLSRKRILTEVENSVQERKISSKKNKKKLSFVSQLLSLERIEKITTVTGINIGTRYISWLNISVPSLNVLDWNVMPLPDYFMCQENQLDSLKLAYDVKNSLPSSDLYVMEKFLMQGRKMNKRLNYIYLSSMLMVLLNDPVTDSTWKDKVVFQNQKLVNKLHNILVGGERTSAQPFVEEIIIKSLNAVNCKEKTSDVYSCVQFKPQDISEYKQSNLMKKEELSLVLLVTLSFIDVIIFKNQESILKMI